jgi:O-acetylhomoserine (thiol)-lyase
MQRMSDSALSSAEHLAGPRGVDWVIYPACRRDRLPQPRQALLPDGRRRGLHLRPEGRLRRGGGLWSELKLFSHLANIGRHPQPRDPPGLHDPPPAHRRAAQQAGAGSEVVRLSIGLEDKEDLIADLDQALAAA